ncbi:MAG: hypothetical protein L0H93_15695 [Nocardioides sp.]|nr:hypothetical protein [Nocardioides sp.]
MITTPYGEQAERIAAALADLVRGPALPDDPRLRPVVLTSRDVVIGALRDRLWNQFRVHVKNTDPAASTSVKFDALLREPIIELGYLVEQFPRMDPDDRLAPGDAPNDPTDPVSKRWTTTANGILVANHVLNTAEPEPWRTTSAAHAALASDTAQIVEAIAVLDQRLRTADALNSHTNVGPGHPSDIATARLVAASVERFAHWVANHHLVDGAVTAPIRPTEFDRPVHLVRVPQDLAPAQRSLESFLQPMAHRNLQAPHRLSASSALAVAHNQGNVVARLHDRIAASAELQAELPRAGQLHALLDDALYATRGLHDTRTPHIHPLLRGQQQEISVGVKNGQVDALSDLEAMDLLSATESTLGTWAAAVRREILRDSTELRVMRRGAIDGPLYGRLTPEGFAIRVLTALAEYKPVVGEPTPDFSTEARSQLRDTLTHTPPFEVVEAWTSPGRHHADRRPPGQKSTPQREPRR